MRYAGFISSGYRELSLSAAGDELKNGFVHVLSKMAPRSPQIIYGSPGKKRFATLPDKPVRALYAGAAGFFAIGGGTLFQVFQDGSVGAALGQVARDANPAQMFTNGPQGFIVSGGKGYLYDANGVSYVVDATTGAYGDTYFLAQTPNTNNFVISDSEDGAAWDPANYGNKEGDAAALRAIFMHRRVLFLHGAESYEAWQDTGDLNFPYGYIQGSYTPVGCGATYSVAETQRFRYWLGGGRAGAGVVWQEAGWGNPARVSNHGIENAIQGYNLAGENTADAVGVTKEHLGHYWYELHFPSVNVILGQPRGATWVYDETTSAQLGSPQWHERAQWDSVHSQWLRDRACQHVYVDAWGKHFVGDHTTGDIYEESMGLFDDAGDELPLLRSAPFIGDEQKRITFGPFILDMQVGGATLYEDDQAPRIFPAPQVQRAPKISVQISDDGGYTWSDEIFIECGMMGDYRSRAIFNRGGQSWNRCYRVTCSERIRKAFLDAFIGVNGQAA